MTPSEPQAIEVARQLEEDILFGRLAPGARLVEDVLIARFDATRHQVRQALVELERNGIVVRERNKGAAVKLLTPTEIGEIYEVRELLQRQAVLRIRLPAPAELIEQLQRLNSDYARHLRERDFRALHEANDAFHLALFAGCGNPHLVNSIRHYMWLSLPVRAKTMADVKRARQSEQEHREMIQLLQGKDSRALAKLCVAHIQAAKQCYLGEQGETLHHQR